MHVHLSRHLPAACALLLASTCAAAEPVPEHYLVIGSFGSAANAARWADYNEAFGTQVSAETTAPTGHHYRVLVGPLSAAATPYLQAILSGAGIVHSWPLVRCPHRPAVAGMACPGLPAAAIAER